MHLLEIENRIMFESQRLRSHLCWKQRDINDTLVVRMTPALDNTNHCKSSAISN